METPPGGLSGAEIEDLVDRFATTAAIAETAGFDGIQIHAAHGYLIAQFLSPLANQRTDDWGGDSTRRLRFLLEVVRRIRATVGPGFAVGIKLNSADFQRGGFSEAESRDVVARLAQEGLDLIEISGGSYEAPAMMGTARSAGTLAREAYFLDYAQTVRHLARDVPLAVTGGFRSHTAMATAIAHRTCDLIGLGRPTCTTPDAANVLFQPHQTRLPVRTVRLGLRRTLGLVADLKTLDGALDLQWHTDQLHRLAGGAEPDPNRPRWRTLLAMLNRNGLAAFRRQRQ
ncbi:oxidoreductase [Amycolatopsis aidingensis]|uniref:oxidoreductase n=1 Tax=Amycolatopsis aidingensis TaxID=2842453 RepID=UPI0022B6DB1C|nr:hypothetical protein [Amycolatopsis aidingensis]